MTRRDRCGNWEVELVCAARHATIPRTENCLGGREQGDVGLVVWKTVFGEGYVEHAFKLPGVING